MNIKTIILVFLFLSILFSGCAAEVEYWIKRMEEAEKKSAEKSADTKTGETQAEESKQSVSMPPAPVTPVAPPVTWPSTEKTSTTQEPVQSKVQESAPVTPAMSTPEITTEQLPAGVQTKAKFTINIKGGEKYIGEIILDEIPFKSAHGIIHIKPENMTSFVDGNILMKDGTSIKGSIDQETVKFKTDLFGELETKTSEIESITR